MRRILPLVLLLALVAPRPARADQELYPQGKPTKVLVGREGASATYTVVSDREVVFRLEGPGTLSGFAKTHYDSTDTDEKHGVLRLAGVPGLPAQIALDMPASRVGGYADDRAGSPSRGDRLSLVIPAVRHELRLTGSVDGGGPLFVALYFEGPAQWGTKIPRPRKPYERLGFVWGMDASLDFTYDDNAFKMSEAFIEEYRERRYWNEEKFQKVDRVEDVILSPGLSLEGSRKIWDTGQTRLAFRYARDQYVYNTALDNHEFRAGVRQFFGRNSLEVYYSYSPSKYLRQLNDRPPLVSSNTPVVSEQFRLERNRIVSAWRQRVSKDLNVTLGFTQKLYYYNKPHLENDINSQGLDVDVYYSFTRSLRLTVSYGFENATARAIDVEGEDALTSPASDGTYKGNTFNSELRWRPRQKSIKRWFPDLRARAQYGVDYYSAKGTSTISDDTYHVGRQDNYYTYQLKSYRPLPAFFRSFGLPKDVDMSYGFSYAQRDTDSPWWGDIKEDKNWISRTWWLGFSTTLF